MFEKKRDAQPPQGEVKLDETNLAIDSFQVRHLFGPDKELSTSFEAATAVIGALRNAGVSAHITAGGISLAVTGANVLAAARTLAVLGIDINSLGDKTFHQQLVEAGGLDKLAAKDPLGRAGLIIDKLTQGSN